MVGLVGTLVFTTGGAPRRMATSPPGSVPARRVFDREFASIKALPVLLLILLGFLALSTVIRIVVALAFNEPWAIIVVVVSAAIWTAILVILYRATVFLTVLREDWIRRQ